MDSRAAVESEILQQIRDEMSRSYRPRDGGQPRALPAAGDAAGIESSGIRSALAAMHAGYALVGRTPPEPPTLRGRMGARLVKLVQRLLFWYTPQIVHFQYSTVNAFEEMAKSLESAGSRVGELQRSIEKSREAVRQMGKVLDAERELFASLHSENQALRSALVEWEQRSDRQVEGLRPRLLALEQRIVHLLEEFSQETSSAWHPNGRSGIADEAVHNTDAFYAALEDEFRGSREDIRRRLGVYLPKLEDAGIGGDAMPILDVGCGRGEWLELLLEHHWQASGVDLNRVLLAICRERGLPVTEADAIEYLQVLPAESMGGVTAFHLIEHLPLTRLLDLLDAVVRVLKPGGVAIFETPNPNNVLVGARYFYLDPTHRHPIPPELGRFLAESRGLRKVEILELNPWPPEHHLNTNTGGEVAGRFNECFYGPQDYAIIGWKV